MNKTGWLRGRNLLATACMFGALSASPAWADEAQPKPSPRTAVEIGGASVVLVTANDRLYAFVDRLDDNAPVADGKLGVALPDGSNLLLTQVSDGYYVAPYDRTGHMRDAFLVSLASADGTGEAATEIAYDDMVLAEAPAPARATGSPANLAVSIVSGLIGAVLAFAGMALIRGLRRRTPPVGPVQVA